MACHLKHEKFVQNAQLAQTRIEPWNLAIKNDVLSGPTAHMV